MMDTILQGMDGVICYLDDIMVSGRTEEEHLTNLRKVLKGFRSMVSGQNEPSAHF